MESVFLNLLNMSITAGWIILAVVALRFLLKRAPKALLMILWVLVGVRLLIPVSIESVLSLIPSAETVPQSVLTAEVPKIDSGIGVVNEIINPILPRGASPALPGSAAPAVPQGGANEAAAQIVGMSANPLAVITKIAAWTSSVPATAFPTIVRKNRKEARR